MAGLSFLDFPPEGRSTARAGAGTSNGLAVNAQTTRSAVLLEILEDDEGVVRIEMNGEEYLVDATPGRYVVGALVAVIVDANERPQRVIGPLSDTPEGAETPGTPVELYPTLVGLDAIADDFADAMTQTRADLAEAAEAIEQAQEDIEAADARITANTQAAAAVAADLATEAASTATALAGIRTDLAGLDSDLTQAQADIVTAQAAADTVARNLAAESADVAVRLADVNFALATLDARADTLDTDLATAQTQLTDARTRLATAEADLTQAQTDIITAQTTANTVASDLAAEHTATAAALAGIRTDLTDVETDLATAQADIVTAQTTANTVASDLATEAASTASALAGIRTDLADIDSRQESLAGDLSTAETSLADARSRLSTAETELVASAARITAAEADIVQTANDLADAQTDLEKAGQDIRDLFTMVDGGQNWVRNSYDMGGWIASDSRISFSTDSSGCTVASWDSSAVTARLESEPRVPYKDLKGKTVTVSVWIHCGQTTPTYFRAGVMIGANDQAAYAATKSLNMVSQFRSGEWVRASATTTLTGSQFDTYGDDARIWFYVNTNSSNTVPFDVKLPKVEIGETMTAWSPHPLDQSDSFAAIAQQLADAEQAIDRNRAELATLNATTLPAVNASVAQAAAAAAAADARAQTAQQAAAAAAARSFGQRNMVWNSRWDNGLAHWETNGTAAQSEVVADATGKHWLHATSLGTSDAQGRIQRTWRAAGQAGKNKVQAEPGESYTLQALVYGTGTVRLGIGFASQSGSGTTSSSTDIACEATPRIVSYTRTCPANKAGFYVWLGATGGQSGEEVWITDVMLSKGTEPVDWTPAPEDADEAFAEHDAAISANEQAITSAQGALTQAQADIATNAGAISTASGLLADARTRLSTAEGALAAAEADIAANSQAISANTSSIQTAQTSLTDARTRLATAESDLAAAQADIAANTSAITGVADDLSDAADSLSTRIDANAGAISTASGLLADARSRLSTAEGALAAAEADIAANSQAISANTSSIQTAQTSLADARTRLATAESDLADAQADIAANTSAISTNAGAIADASSALATAESQLADARSRLSTAEGAIAQAEADIETNSGAITVVAGELADASSALSARISAIGSDVETALTGGVSIDRLFVDQGAVFANAVVESLAAHEMFASSVLAQTLVVEPSQYAPDPLIAPGAWTLNARASISDGVFVLSDDTTATSTAAGPWRSSTPGTKLVWSFEVRKSDDDVAGAFGLTIRRSNGSSSVEGWVKTGAASTYSTEWTTYSGVYTIPAGTSDRIRVAAIRRTTAASSEGWYEVRNISVRPQVGSILIQDGSITGDKIVASSVAAAVGTFLTLNASQINAGTLAAGRIGAGTIDASKLNVSSVAAELATVLELNADRITSGTISTARLDAQAVAAAVGTFLTLNANQITAGTIDAARLNAQDLYAKVANLIEVSADKIVSGTISTARLDAQAVAAAVGTFLTLNASQINAGTLAAGRIGAGTIDASKLNVSSVAAELAIVLELNADRITSGTISTARLDAQAVAAAVGTFLTLNASQITAGTLSADRLDAQTLYAKVANLIELSADKIVSGTIATARLDASEIAAAVATIIELDAGVIRTGTLDANLLNASQVYAKIANLIEVDAGKVRAGELSAEVTYTGTLNATQINAGTLDVGRLDAADVAAAVGSFLELDAGVIRTGTLDASVIGANTIGADHIETNSIGAEHIVAGGIDATDLIATGTITGAQVDAQSVAATVGTFLRLRATQLDVTPTDPSDPDSGKITAAQIDVPGLVRTAELRAITVDAANIIGGTIDASHLNAQDLYAKVADLIRVSADRIDVTPTDPSDPDSGKLTAAQIDVTGVIAAADITAKNVEASRILATQGGFTSAVVNSLLADELFAGTMLAHMISVEPWEYAPDPAVSASWWDATRASIEDGVFVLSDSRTTWSRIWTPLQKVEPGTTLAWTLQVRKSDAGVRGGFGLSMNTDDGTPMGADDWVLNRAASGYSTKWQTVEGVWEVPEGVDAFRVSIVKRGSAPGTSSGHYEVRNLSVRPQVGSVLIKDGAITGDKIVVDSVLADEIIAAGTITASKIVADQAGFNQAIIDQLAANSVFADAMLAQSLVIQPREYAPSPAVLPSWWQLNARAAIVGDAFVLSDNTTSYSNALGQWLTVEPGATLAWSFEVRKSDENVAGKFGVGLAFRSRSDDYFKTAGASEYSTDWQTFTGVYTVPDGVTEIRVQAARRTTAASSDGWYEVRNVSVRPQVGSVLIKNGSITGDKIVADTIKATHIDVTDLLQAREMQTIRVSADRIDVTPLDPSDPDSGKLRAAQIDVAGVIAAADITAKNVEASRILATQGGFTSAVVTSLLADELFAGTMLTQALAVEPSDLMPEPGKVTGFWTRSETTNIVERPDTSATVHYGILYQFNARGDSIQREVVGQLMPIQPGATYAWQARVGVNQQGNSRSLIIAVDEYAQNSASGPVKVRTATVATIASTDGAGLKRGIYVPGQHDDTIDQAISYARVRVIYTAGTDTSGYRRIWDWSMRPQVGSVLIKDGSITGDKIVVDSVLADEIIAAGTVTASKIVADQAGFNQAIIDQLAANSVFADLVHTELLSVAPTEYAPDPATRKDAWSLSTGATVQQYSGPASGKGFRLADTANASVTAQTARMPILASNSGSTIAWAAKLRKTAATVTGSFKLSLVTYNSTGTATVTAVHTRTAEQATTTEASISGTFTLPAGTCALAVRLEKATASTGSAGYWYVYDVSVKPQVGAALIQNGVITGDHITAAGIDATDIIAPGTITTGLLHANSINARDALTVGATTLGEGYGIYADGFKAVNANGGGLWINKDRGIVMGVSYNNPTVLISPDGTAEFRGDITSGATITGATVNGSQINGGHIEGATINIESALSDITAGMTFELGRAQFYDSLGYRSHIYSDGMRWSRMYSSDAQFGWEDNVFRLRYGNGQVRLGNDGTINITNGACSLILGTDGSITARRGSQSRAII